jgi:predicted DsbA family dithiol-disulfide isomerase
MNRAAMSFELRARRGRERPQGIRIRLRDVPLFILGRRYAAQGTQPIQHFLRLIAKVRAEDAPRWRALTPL